MADSTPEQLSGASLDISAENRARLKQLFPTVFTETVDDKGELVESLDFEKLKAELGTFTDIFESCRERYGMGWPGKKDSLRLIQTQTHATLKPCREESVNFDTTENLFIEGDNLEVLKLLQKSYYGKVKMIYIDPPYNTGKEFIYPDNYSESLETYLEYAGLIDGEGKKFSTNTANEGRFHTKWLNMMYPRLYLARNLLRDDGVIFISIDENEIIGLRTLMNEIFGEENFTGEIVWKNSSKNDQAYISIQHEYILSYCKNKSSNNGEWREKKEGLDEIYKAFDGFKRKHGTNWDEIHKEALEWYKQFPEANPIYSSKHYAWMDENGVYFPADISGPNYGQYRYDVLHPITGKICKEPASGWRYPEETMKQRIKDNLVHFGKDETTVPNNKTYLKDTECQSLTSVKYRDGRVASKILNKLLGGNFFTNPKDVDILILIAKAIGIEKDDTIIDFFAGSGTTAHAVLDLNKQDNGNRKFICVQLPEPCAPDSEAFKAGYKTISDIGKERIRRVIKKLHESEEGKLDLENSKDQDRGFRVLKLDQSNFRQWQQLPSTATPEQIAEQLDLHIDHINHKASQEDLLFEILLKAGFKPTEKVSVFTAEGKQVFSIAEGALLICLEESVTRELIDAVIEANPQQFICLDSAFHGNDQLKANAVQTFNARNMQKEKHNQIVFRTV